MPERVLPREFPVPPELIIPLSNAELQELGTFTAIWSQIDWIIMLMIAHLTKTELGTLQLMMETMTTGPRISLLRRFCQQDPDETKKAVKKLCEKNGGLVEDRNHIIHGTWAIEWDCATGICRVACIYEKNKRDPIPAERLKELSDRAAKFSNALGCLLEKMNPLLSGDRPRRFFFGKGGQEGHPPPPWPPEQQQ